MKNISDFFLLIIAPELEYLGSTMFAFKMSKLPASELCAYGNGHVLGVEDAVYGCVL